MADSGEILKQVANLRSVKGDLAGAIKLLEVELPKFQESEKALGYRALGTLYSDVGRNKDSKNALIKAISLSQTYKNILIEADASRRLGYVVWTTEGDEAAALLLVQQAEEVIKSESGLQFIKVKASIQALIGNIHFDQGRYQQAESAYLAGLKLARSCGYIERESTILGDLGNLALAQKQYQLALDFLNHAREIAENKYRHELPAALLRIGKVYFDRDNPDRDLSKSEEYFRQTLEIASHEGWKKDEAESYLAMARLKAEQGNKKDAAEFNQKALEIYFQIGINPSKKPRS